MGFQSGRSSGAFFGMYRILQRMPCQFDSTFMALKNVDFPGSVEGLCPPTGRRCFRKVVRKTSIDKP